MANYVFESMSAADAASFSTADSLFFLSATASSLGVTDVASNALTNESIVLSSGSRTLTF